MKVGEVLAAYEAVQVPARVIAKTQAANRVKVSVNGAVVLDEVPPDATAVGVPARVVRIGGQKVSNCNEQLDQIHMADPVSMELCRLRGELERLQNQVNEMESRGKTPE